jgi:hypothetical protein
MGYFNHRIEVFDPNAHPIKVRSVELNLLNVSAVRYQLKRKEGTSHESPRLIFNNCESRISLIWNSTMGSNQDACVQKREYGQDRL